MPDRLSEFRSAVNVSPEAFERIENAGGVRLDQEARAAIERALREYEYVRAYERAGVNEPRRTKVKRLAEVLPEVVTLCRALNESPRLWPYIAYEAEVDFEEELVRLQRLAESAKALRDLIEAARRAKMVDPWLPRLLLQLEKQAHRAGLRRTGVSNAKGKRGGRFVRFCDAILAELPNQCRPAKSIGSPWERIYPANSRARHARGKKVWPGKAHPVQLKR